MVGDGAHPNRRPLLALLLLSPVIAEMLSGSSAPLEWLNPAVPLLLIWLYGSGVLVMRRRALCRARRVCGVWLTIYHAVVSIAVPIFLVDWIWPRTRGVAFTSRRGYIAAIGFLASATIFIDLVLTPYRPSVWHLLGALAAVAFLVWAAKEYATRLWDRLPSGTPRSPRVYAIAGFAFIGGSFLIYGGGPALGVYPIVTLWEGALVLLAAMLLIRRTSGDPRWARQRFAFVGGVMGFLIVLAGFLELAGWRGMGVVAAAFSLLLVRWYRRAPSVSVPEPAPATGSLFG